eukprot:g3251.t1
MIMRSIWRRRGTEVVRQLGIATGSIERSVQTIQGRWISSTLSTRNATDGVQREGSIKTDSIFLAHIRSIAEDRLKDSTLDAYDKTFITINILYDKPGVLEQVIQCFRKFQVNMSSIESRLKSFAHEGPVFDIDFDGNLSEVNVQNMLVELRMHCADLRIREPRECDWFPMNIRDLDLTRETLDGGTDLINEDHPGFKDEAYRKRREEIVSIAQTYRHGIEIPRVDYTEDETRTWGVVYDKIMSSAEHYACREFLDAMPQMEKHCGYARDNIPQLVDISNFLQQKTGFTLRPVQGLLSARDFLNALAFRVFFSTQYIRHHGNPLYTPEPDICHELMGHVPMFANRSFADFSHQIGLASLAASDDDIDRLASIYWFSVEFGLTMESSLMPGSDGDDLGDDDAHQNIKAYGAGLLSSFGEIEWSCADVPSLECRESGGMMVDYADLKKPTHKPFDASAMAKQPFPITTYQPVYFVADSLEDVKRKTSQFCDSIQRPFFPQYDALTQSVKVSRAVRRRPRTSTVEIQAQKQREYFEKLRKDGAKEAEA